MTAPAWSRSEWLHAQMNLRLAELERDLEFLRRDASLSRFQRGVLMQLAIDSAAATLAEYEAVAS